MIPLVEKKVKLTEQKKALKGALKQVEDELRDVDAKILAHMGERPSVPCPELGVTVMRRVHASASTRWSVVWPAALSKVNTPTRKKLEELKEAATTRTRKEVVDIKRLL